MIDNKYLFQYCQKIVVINQDFDRVLLAKRKGEADYDGVFSFIGGKLETTDTTLVNGMNREKSEEIGEDAKLDVYADYSVNELFMKKDGHSMVLPHYLAVYISGDIDINDEYSEYQWVPIAELDEFKPMIETVPKVVKKLLKLQEVLQQHCQPVRI